MRVYRVYVQPRVDKQLRALEKSNPAAAGEAARKIQNLEKNPYPFGAKKMQGEKKTWRIKVKRTHRIVYSVQGDNVTLEFVGPRKDAY